MKIIQYLSLLIVFITGHGQVQSQILSVSIGTDLTISAGTPFSADGITITPAGNFTLNNVSLSRTATIANPASGSYISRVYQFTGATQPFTGTIQINYEAGELNGLTESALLLNVHDGANWQNFSSATNEVSQHFVLSSALSNLSLNELTLTEIATVLPVSWLSFTARPQGKQALLQWSTASEQHTRDYLIQHSMTGSNWHTIGSVAAKGNSSAVTNYQYMHTAPVTGKNQYRIQQTDADGKSSYSEVRSVLFGARDAGFAVLINPAGNGVLKIAVYSARELSFYSPGGQLLWKKQLEAGTQSVDITGYARGLYYISDRERTEKVVIQ